MQIVLKHLKNVNDYEQVTRYTQKWFAMKIAAGALTGTKRQLTQTKKL